jgi:hypothetical protein
MTDIFIEKADTMGSFTLAIHKRIDRIRFGDYCEVDSARNVLYAGSQ